MIPAVVAKNLCHTYGEGTRALDGVDITVRGGEFVSLLASNGSGKTTLLKLMSGLLKLQDGSLEINGEDVRRLKQEKLYRTVGVTFQNPDDQLFGSTVGEDVAFGPRNMGLAEDEVQKRVLRSLSIVGAEGLAGRAIHHLSYGQKKRVALAGAMAMEPSMLLLDEPTAGLDPAGEASIMRLLGEINRKRGVTVVLATHSIDMLPLFADKIYVLKSGRVIKHGDPEAVFTSHELLEDAGLRLPYVSSLIHKMKEHDGLPMNGLPLTVGEARKRFLELIPEDVLLKHARKPE